MLKDREFYLQVIQDVARRVVAIVQPERIVLFGSAVKGEMNLDSDLDILVIVKGPVHRRRMAQSIYRGLHGVGLPVDVVVATEQDIFEYKDKVGSIIRPALAEGQVIYDAQQ